MISQLVEFGVDRHLLCALIRRGSRIAHVLMSRIVNASEFTLVHMI